MGEPVAQKLWISMFIQSLDTELEPFKLELLLK